MTLWDKVRGWFTRLLYSATEYPAPPRPKRRTVLFMDESSPVPDRQQIAFAHARALAAAEAVAERAAPIHRFKDGATVVANDGTRYTAKNVQKQGWRVSMTLQRETPKRPAGVSPRKWDRMKKQQRRRGRSRLVGRPLDENGGIELRVDRGYDAACNEARRLAGCE